MFSIAFAVLAYWLLGFVLEDINRLPGPSYSELEQSMIASDFAERDVELNQQITQTTAEIDRLKKQQTILKSGIENSQRAVAQLQELLASDQDATADNQQAFAENIRLFLADQRSYQELNQQIVDRNGALDDLKLKREAHQVAWNKLREPVNAEYQRLRTKHNFRLAGMKLAFLLPILALWAFLFRWTQGNYAPLIYAFGAAISAKIIQVIHQHFPSRLFNYILTAAALAVVTGIVVYLIRMLKNPNTDWLQKQYREAYESFLCPVCDYPIRRGPLKYMSWTRRSIRKAIYRAPVTTDSHSVEAAYTCPICSTQLFESCKKCDTIRHSLLPACHQCGDVTI
jgi:predicted RNA-binding Zn-ribbon protein involved in translation (DUF1610 family)